MITRNILFAAVLFCFASCESNNSDKNQDNTVADTSNVAVSASNEELQKPANTKFEDTVIEVNSFDELYRHIGNNRTLKLGEGVFSFPEKVKNIKNINLEMNYGLVVKGISNMKIVGGGTNPTKLIQPNPSFKVIEFNGCNNIVIENITAGHEPEKGYCAASVLIFNNSNDIFLNNNILYGSGYEGLTTFKVDNLNCSKTTIRECSFQVMSISQSANIRFFNCVFTENNKPSGAGKFYLAQSDIIVFNSCMINNNQAYIGQPTADPLFRFDDCEEVYIENCNIENNVAASLTNSKNVKENSNIIKGNSWQKAN